MSNDFSFGVTAGFIVGALLMTSIAIGIKEIGRDECEKPLPRDQKCTQEWVRPKANP